MNTRRTRTVDWLVDEIDKTLARFRETRLTLSLRGKVRLLVELRSSVRELGVCAVAPEISAGSARERLRLYLVRHCGTPIAGCELEVVSGISEYARRVRELRVQDGYQIATGSSPDPDAEISLKPDEYLLVSDEPDRNAAQRWHLANRIRKRGAGGKQRLREYLEANVGRVVTTEELAYVAGGAKSYQRRIRELRTEEGLAIATRSTGRPDLAPGQYMLETADRVAEPHDRHIPQAVRVQVFERDGSRCVVCGWQRDHWSRSDPRIFELHHRASHVAGGTNSADNLVVLCSRCHDRVHAGECAVPDRAD